MQIDKTVKLTEQDFTYEDKKELKRQNVIFLGGVALIGIVALIFIFLLIPSLVWRAIIGMIFFSLIGLFVSSLYSNLTDLKYGKKVVKVGKVWDTYEEFHVQKQGDKEVATRKFFFRVGDMKHRFFQFSFDKEEDIALPKEAVEFGVGQTVEMHFTKSGYQLHESVLREALKSISDTYSVEQKIKSKRLITQNEPRRWSEKESGEYFYLLVRGVLIEVDESVFYQVVTGSEVDMGTDMFLQNRTSLKVKGTKGEWLEINKIAPMA